MVFSYKKSKISIPQTLPRAKWRDFLKTVWKFSHIECLKLKSGKISKNVVNKMVNISRQIEKHMSYAN
jgi:hypothetical protein